MTDRAFSEKRARARLKEHGPHGWAPEASKLTAIDERLRLMRCPCGYLGWVLASVLR